MSSTWEDEEGDDPLLHSLAQRLASTFCELEFFLYIRHKTQSSSYITLATDKFELIMKQTIPQMLD